MTSIFYNSDLDLGKGRFGFKIFIGKGDRQTKYNIITAKNCGFKFTSTYMV